MLGGLVCLDAAETVSAIFVDQVKNRNTFLGLLDPLHDLILLLRLGLGHRWGKRVSSGKDFVSADALVLKDAANFNLLDRSRKVLLEGHTINGDWGEVANGACSSVECDCGRDDPLVEMHGLEHLLQLVDGRVGLIDASIE